MVFAAVRTWCVTPWTEAMRQLGNAVPVRLAEVVASSVRSHLTLAAERDHADIVANSQKASVV